jgi:hypothetical protein
MRMRFHPRLVILLALAAAAGCRTDAAAPAQPRHLLEIHGGDLQFGAQGSLLLDPLQVVVSDELTERPARGVTVQWRVVAGPPGAELLPASVATDSAGIARVTLRLGPETGTYRIQATAEGAGTSGVVFQAFSVVPPRIDDLAPAVVTAGQSVTITGAEFGAGTDQIVLFDGLRGRVLSGTPTSLQVEVPRCLTDREATVTVQRGAVVSQGRRLSVLAGDTAALVLAPGEGRTFTSETDFACFRLASPPTGATYLLVPQNAGEKSRSPFRYQVVGLGAAPFAAAQPAPRTAGAAAAAILERAGFGQAPADFEARLRHYESGILPHEAIRPEPGAPGVDASVATPRIGDRKTFQVINKDHKFSTVTAEVKFVSDHAILYQDVAAPDNGLSANDFANFGRVFDDPIHGIVSSVFGPPSDVDANGRIVILFTPVVNEMTPRGSSSFIAGFFYGHDLTTRPGSNRAEIFYSLVADPAAKFGDARTVSRILSTVPAVLAHEFQHMVHFNQRVLLRGVNQESLWLSEALAHMAEDLVADAFQARGEGPTAASFRAANRARANLYLQRPADTGLLAVTPPGTLEERGASWLFLKHLMGHHGGNDLLRRVTQTTRASVDNVRAETGTPWQRLVENWAVALWADGAPELAGSAVEPRFTFPNMNLRSEVTPTNGGFPLQPRQFGFQGFTIAEELASSTGGYIILRHNGPTAASLSLGFHALPGSVAAAAATPQLSVLRIR